MNRQTSVQNPIPDLPEGTVTFLFTDIEGSTRLLQLLREQYAVLLADHNRILREVISGCHGHEVDTQGDAFFTVFSRASQAVCAAVEAQRKLAEFSWPEDVTIKVRMGIHTGEPWSGEQGYVGMDVHRAARIAQVGHGGQVLLSETTTALVQDELPQGASILDLGNHLLKDMTRPERLYQLVIEGLPDNFPPLTSLEAQEPELVQLPSIHTPVVRDKGRSLEIDALGGLRLHLEGKQISGLASRKAEALILFLAYTARPHSRETLAELLWEARAPGRALSNLRVVLASLRKQLAEFFLITRDTVEINPDAEIHLDARIMEQDLASGSYERALDLYQGEFLQGFYLSDAGEFDHWAQLEQNRLHMLVVNGFHQLLDSYADQGRWEDSITYNQRLIQIEPLDENAHRKMMLALIYTNRRVAALAHYENFTQLLKEELGVSPENETTLLFQQIKSSEMVAPSAPPIRREEFHRREPAFLDKTITEKFEKPLFVARQFELEQLETYLSDTLSGSGRLVFVIGGPGRGKTALLNEFISRASSSVPDLIAVTGACDAFTGIGDPYLPFREILSTLTGDIEPRWRAGEISRTQAQRIWEATPDILSILLDRGEDLLEVMVSSRSLLESAGSLPEMDHELVEKFNRVIQAKPSWYQGQEPLQLFQQVSSVFHEIASKHPLLLVLDDFQWADNASISLLFHLGRRLVESPIMIACAYRPEEVASGREGKPHPLQKILAEFKRNFGNIWIDLSRADETSAMDFVNAYIDTEPNQLDEEFRLALLKHTGGHPLFTIELLKSLQASGYLEFKDNQWIANPSLNWELLPSRVEGVIEQRLDRLNQELADILNIACIQGEVFSPLVIARVQGVDELELTRRLSQELATRHRLVREKGDLLIRNQYFSQFQFTHTLIHRYLYNKVSRAERRLLHSRVAEILEDLYQADIQRVAAQLVHHYEIAGNSQRALIYMVKAGDRARAMYANDEAEMFYTRAIENQERMGLLEEQSRTLLKLGLVYTASFNSIMAQQAYSRAFETWELPRETINQEDIQKAADTLRIAIEEPRTLDPGSAEDDISAFIVSQLFEGLVRIGQDYNVLPAAAKRWEVNEDGTRYLFNLRSDLRWSDGTQLKASDFEYAWKRNLNKELNSPTASLLFPIKNALPFREKQIDDANQVGVHAVDDSNLEVLLVDPTPYLPYLLAHPIFSPLPQWIIESCGINWITPENIVTNGPFKLAEILPGEELTLVHNPFYHQHTSAGFQKVVCRTFESIWPALDLYKTGEIDMVSLLNADPATLAKAAKSFRGELVSIPHPSVLYLSFRSDKPPFDNPLLRKAFIHAVDRRELARQAYQESHLAATGGFVPPGMVGHSPDIGLEYEPILARNLLSQAGFPGGRDFPQITWLQPTASKEERIVPFLKRTWKNNLGVELEPISLEWTEFYQRFTSNPAELTILGWSADYPDPDNMLRVTFHSKEGLNVPRWHNLRFDTLVETALKVSDHENRMELYRQADQILVAQEAVVMPLGYGSARILVKPWIKLPQTPSFQLPFEQISINKD